VCVVKRESTRARKTAKQWASECNAGVFVKSACREAITFAEPSQSDVHICGESRFKASLISTKALVVADVRKNRHVHLAWQIPADISRSLGRRSQHPESSRAGIAKQTRSHVPELHRENSCPQSVAPIVKFDQNASYHALSL
jgi:hypothetical protein